MKSNKGFSLLEVLLAVVILGIVSYSISFLFLTKQRTKTEFKSAYESGIAELNEQILQNLEDYHVYFSAAESDKMLGGGSPPFKDAFDNFPWSVSPKGIVPASDCPDCVRRLGLIVRRKVSSDGRLYPNLFEVTLLGIEKKSISNTNPNPTQAPIPANYEYKVFHEKVNYVTNAYR